MTALGIIAAVIAAIAGSTVASAVAGDAERMAEQLADLVNETSEHVHCTAQPEGRSILCAAETAADEVAAERYAAYLGHLIEEHSGGVLDGWTVTVSTFGRRMKP